MLAAALPALSQWDSFYVIVGSSAGALTGLMFVVIALTSPRRINEGAAALRSFATPTIVHFVAVLILAAVFSMPLHTKTSLGLCLLAAGIIALAYIARIYAHARRQVAYEPDREDLVWHFALPTVAYACILVSGAMMWSSPAASLNTVAASTLLLLVVGIHNAWDGAVWSLSRTPD